MVGCRRLRMNIEKCLKFLRGKKGWTQADLHRATGYERAYISKLESGRVTDISVRTAIRLCRAFGISVEEFAELCRKMGGDSWDKSEASATAREE